MVPLTSRGRGSRPRVLQSNGGGVRLREQDRTAAGVFHKRVRWRSLGGQAEGIREDFGGAWRARGVRVEKRFVEDGYHAVEIFDETKALALAQNIKNFVLSLTSQSSN